MLVSIVTPSFNQDRWLQANLDSVARQTYPAIEHIVADGGSTDHSVSILERHGRGGLRWWSRPDGGQSEAINAAFRATRGDVIGWLNSDDAYFARDVVERAVDFLNRHRDVAAVYGHACLVDASGHLLQILWAPPFSRKFLVRYNFIVQPTVFIRRDALGETLVDPRFQYMMDRELWLRLSLDHQVARMNAIVAIDRHHDGRKSYRRLDLRRTDEILLKDIHPDARTVDGRLGRKALKAAFRVAGLSLLHQATVASSAIDLGPESTLPLAARQLFVPRRRMRADG